MSAVVSSKVSLADLVRPSKPDSTNVDKICSPSIRLETIGVLSRIVDLAKPIQT